MMPRLFIIKFGKKRSATVLAPKESIGKPTTPTAMIT